MWLSGGTQNATGSTTTRRDDDGSEAIFSNALSFAYTVAGTQLRTVTRATASGAADQTLTRVRCGYDSQPKGR